jgi:outer membrane protein assembly factor BamA
MLYGQDSIDIILQYPAEIQTYAEQIPKVATRQDAEIALTKLVFQLQNDGWLTAAWKWLGDIPGEVSHVGVAEIDCGKRVYWATLNAAHVDPLILRTAGFDPDDWKNTTYDHQQALNFLRSLVAYANNHGYPFASAQLDSITWQDSSLSASVKFEKNMSVHFDTIRLVGTLNVSANFLEQFTQIISGQPYDQSLILQLPSRIKELTFATMTKPPLIELNGNGATVIIYADAKKSSQFDFIIGVLPNNEITGRLLITGDMRLHLQNVFHAGEQIHFQYTKLESASKSMDASFTYPYLPHIPLGPDASFHLYLKDSTFLERNTSVGVVWQIAGNHTLKGFTSFFNSSVLRPDTNFVLSQLALPSMLDLKENAYGLLWQFQHLDYIYNPSRGYAFALSGSAGTRTILENAAITALTSELYPDYDFASLYDSIATQTLSLKYRYDVQYFIPLFKRMTILLRGQGASIIHPDIVENELYRIGGNQLLRGFDEQSISVSDYHIGTIEYRYLLSQNAFASLFFDGGAVANRAIEDRSWSYPIGFGAGLRFETKAGIFGLSYALGGTDDEPVQFRNTKVHFGYINYF